MMQSAGKLILIEDYNAVEVKSSAYVDICDKVIEDNIFIIVTII
jgi:hypothetical protein